MGQTDSIKLGGIMKKKHVAPIYAFGITWVIMILIFYYDDIFYTNILNIMDILVIAVFSLSVSIIVKIICWIIDSAKFLSRFISKQFKKIFGDNVNTEKELYKTETQVQPEIQPKEDKEPERPLPAEIIKATKDLKAIENELLYIQQESVSGTINNIVKLSKAIINKMTQEQHQISSNRNFIEYYLPTTLELVCRYNHLEKQDFKTENIYLSKQKISESLQMIEQAFSKKLNGLFNHTATDIEMDMKVLQDIISKDGLK